MIRALCLFVGLAVVAAVAAWLADRPGNIAIHWQGWRIEASVTAGAVAFAVLLVAGAITCWVWLWIVRSPRVIGRMRRDSRRRRGEAALFSCMNALAAGEGTEALKLGRRAGELLADSPLPLFLSAQAAQQAGDMSEAARLYRRMLDSPNTEFLGIRGLMAQAMRAGDTQAALRHARRAQVLRPTSLWVQNLLFSLQSAAGLWQEALATLEDASRRKVLDKATGRRNKALTIYAQAYDAEATGETERAGMLARDAHALAPEFVPAALLAARHCQADGETGKAARMIEACWRKSPHPDLASLYLALYPEDDSTARVRRITRLDRLNAGHREGRIALAGVLAAARRWHEAYTYLDEAMAERQERRLFRLLAQVEEGRYGPTAAVEPLQKLLTAPPDDAWVCHGCGSVAAEWSPHCTQCGRFDFLFWNVASQLKGGTAVVQAGDDAGESGMSATLARLSETLPDMAEAADTAEAGITLPAVPRDDGNSGGDIVDASPSKA